MKIVNRMKYYNFLKQAISVLFMVIGFIYLLVKTFAISNLVDFKYIWLAGFLWNEGKNPYSDCYKDTAIQMFHNTSVPDGWVYPPSWSIFIKPIAYIPFETACLLWNILLTLLLLASLWLLFKATKKIGLRLTNINICLIAGFAFIMEATPVTLALGQTPFIVLFGISLLLYGYIHDRRFLSALGLSFIMLKPQIGIVFIPALFFCLGGLTIILIAVCLTFVFCIPAFMQVGLKETFVQMFIRMSGYYSGFNVGVNTNCPAETTSLRTIIDYLLGIEINSIVMIIFAIIIALIIGFLYRKGILCYKNNKYSFFHFICFIVSLISFSVVLHIYDQIILVPILFILPFLVRYSFFMSSIGFLLLFRAGYWGSFTGIFYKESLYSKGSVMASFGILLIFLGFLIDRYFLYKRSDISN